MTKETFEKADELMRKINVHKKAVDVAYQYKNQANNLIIHVNIPGEKPGCYCVEGELMHQILGLICSAEKEKLADIEDEFKAL